MRVMMRSGKRDEQERESDLGDEERERESCKSVESRPRFAFIFPKMLLEKVFWIHSLGSTPLISSF